ncbi:MAG: hypothetical protein EVA47_02115 [Gammaproteobacteria bacterium]|nr:MAG: hypothetical protein EVA47_02115 [Gammaproteobacteria bacterium]
MSIDQKSKIRFTIYCQSFLQIKELTKLEKFFAPILEKKNNFRESSFSKLKKAVSELKLNKPSQIISVTGTNGKGSTLEILSQVLSNNNYKVGLFTSPHLIKFNERIKINNRAVSDKEIIETFKKLENLSDYKSFNFFQLLALACFVIFSNRTLDIWLLEVGLGGRLDPVNCFDADVSVITKIALDHEEILGKGRENIGKEKAGIIRSDQVFIYGEGLIPNSVKKVVDKLNPNFYKVDNSSLELENFHNNSVGIAKKILDVKFKEINSLNEIKKLKGNLNYGRCHKLRKNFIVDASHNNDSVKNLQKFISNNHSNSQIIAIFTCNDLKKIEDLCMPMMDIVDEWYVPDLDSNRVKSSSLINKYLLSKGKIVNLGYDLSQLKEKIDKQEKNSLYVAFGSFILMGKIYESYDFQI